MKKLLLGLLLAVAPLPASAAQVFLLQTPVSQTTASPTISGAGDTVAYVAGGASIILENGLIVSCTCAQLDSATVTISAGTFTGDTLSAAVTAGLTAVYSSPTLTLSGTANVSAYVQALQSVTFSSSNADPTNSGGNLTRTVTWTANNGAHASNQPTTTINVSTPTTAPTLANAGSTDTFTSGGSPTVIESGITTACSCSNLTGATVSISGGLLALDTLDATTVGSITKAYDSSAGVLTLSGTDTKANYQTVLRSVTYSSGLADPTNGGADTSRAISWVASNGASNSAAVTSTIITQNPSVPTIVVAAGNSISYTSGGVGIAVDNALSVSCTCANLSGATLTLSSGFFNGDILTVSTSFGITPVYNSVTGVMSLSGTSTVANYQTLLRTILYRSSAGDPSNGGHNATRTATWVASNGANVSFPATTTINVFLTGQPTWAMTGAVVALNPSINQAWVSGSGTGPLSSQISVTRATTETCYTGINPVAVTYAAPNDFCAIGSGLAIWPSYTNYLPQSNDASASKWVTYCGGNCPLGGSTVTVTGNSVLDPTNVTSQASKVSVVRTSTGNWAAVINNQPNAPAATYSIGVWLKADAGGDVGTVIQFGFNAPSGFTVHNVTLNANWTWVTFANAGSSSGGCVAATQSCQFQIGLTNQPGSGTANTTLAANFDVWGGELNLGTVTFPTVPTALAPVVTAADNVVVNSGSALETALTGAASSVIMNSTLGISSQVATLIDSNGTSWLGEAASNKLTTAVGSAVSTSNTAFWNSPDVEAIARDGNGRTMGLNGSVIVKDTQATSIATPLTLGSTIGTSNNTNYFTGYLGTLNAFNVRVTDSLIGVTGSGTSFFFANNSTCLAITAGTNGSCADSNPCTTLQPCNTITKANSLAYVTNDHLLFNGGDTFIGCLNLTGGVNWNATRAQPGTIDHYGSGNPTLTGNCTAGSAKIGIINLISTDGVIIQNLNFVGDSAGNANRGVSLKNCDSSSAHGNIVIQNDTFTGIHDGPASGHDFGGSVFADGSCNNAAKQVDHVSLINNTAAGATTTATDNALLEGYGYSCAFNFDVIQGNLAFNLGGDPLGVNEAGTGMKIVTCGVGSSNGFPPVFSGTSGGIAQFNVVHDIAYNSNGKCGGPVGLWTDPGEGLIIRENEVYNVGLGTTGGCDKGAFDLDTGGGGFATDDLVERNYSHNNWGFCMLYFGSPQNGSFRWNICDSDGGGWSGGHSSVLQFQGNAQAYIYNNVLASSTAASSVLALNGCLTTGGLFANNIVVARMSGTQWFLNVSKSNQTIICSPAPVGGGIFTHNDWFANGSGALRWWIDAQGSVGTITGSVSGTTVTITANTGVSKVGSLVTGTGIPTSTYLVSCNPACSAGNTATLSQSANVGSETLNVVASASTFANAENLLNEHDGFNVDPLFVNPYQGTICNTTVGSPGPQAGNCPAGMKLQGGSTMHAPAGANLTSFPWNLPANNGGTPAVPTNGQGTVDYWGATLPCPTTGGYPIGAQC